MLVQLFCLSASDFFTFSYETLSKKDENDSLWDDFELNTPIKQK